LRFDLFVRFSDQEKMLPAIRLKVEVVRVMK
jgi:hypothetical protein